MSASTVNQPCFTSNVISKASCHKKDAPRSPLWSLEQFVPLVAFFCIPSPHDPFDCRTYTPHRVSTNISNVDEKFFCSVDMLSTSHSHLCHLYHFSSYFFRLSSLLCNLAMTLLEKLLQYSALLSTFFFVLRYAKCSSTWLVKSL